MARWTQGSAAPVVQLGPSVCALDGKLYVTGGTAGTTRLPVMQIYDTVTGSWSRGPDMPLALQDHAMAAVGRKLYVFGGSTGSSLFTEVYWYDVDSLQWGLSGSLAGYLINHATAVAVGQVIYVFGGTAKSGSEYPMDGSKMVFSYSTVTGSASLVGEELPVARYQMGGAVLDGKVYLMGGLVWEDGVSSKSGRLDVFDPETASFRNLSSMPAAEVSYSAAYGEEVYAVAGNNLLIYSPESNTWRYGESVPVGYSLPYSLDAVGSRLYSVPYDAKPILLLDLREVEIVGAQPAAGFVNEREDNRFSWQISGNASTVQREALLQWRVQTETVVREIPVSGAATAVTIPAGTFPDDVIVWRVSAVTVEGVETGWSDWHTITTVDQPHEPPGNLYPGSGRRNASESMQLSWVTNSPTGSVQKGYEIQVSYEESLNWQQLTGMVVSQDQAHLVEGGTLAPGETGRLSWRVRTYNTDGVAGGWSEAASFLAIAAPSAPRWIGVEEGRARPLARWMAGSQTGYQLRVLRGGETVLDTGWLAGTGQEHRVAEYLHDGGYRFAVRVKNELGMESPWAETAAQIATEARYGIQLDGAAADGAVELEFSVKAR